MNGAGFFLIAVTGLVAGIACLRLVRYHLARIENRRARPGQGQAPSSDPGRPQPGMPDRPRQRPLFPDRSRGDLIAGAAGAATGLLVHALISQDLAMAMFTIILCALLLALTAIDIRTFILPDSLNASLLTCGALFLLTHPEYPLLLHAGGAIAGYASLAAIEVLYRRLRGRDGLGRGDAKLLGALGLWTGLESIPFILLMASLSALVFTLIRAAILGEKTQATTAIAFGPWIGFGGLIVWIIFFAAPN